MTDLRDVLRPIADRLKLQFGYGGQVEFDTACNDIIDPETVLLFVELYDQFTIVAANRSIDNTQPLIIYIVQKGELNEPAESRYPKVLNCTAVTENIFRLLLTADDENDYTTTVGGSALPVLAASTNPMTGIKFTGSYKKVLTKCLQ